VKKKEPKNQIILTSKTRRLCEVFCANPKYETSLSLYNILLRELSGRSKKTIPRQVYSMLDFSSQPVYFVYIFNTHRRTIDASGKRDNHYKIQEI